MTSQTASHIHELPLFSGLSIDKMPAHWLMARLGKRVLRPGGLETTRWLLEQAHVDDRDDVVEFAPGLGVTARSIQQRSPRSYIGIERDANAQEFASCALKKAGFVDARILRGDAANVPLADGSASLVIGEAMLSMQPQEHKAAIISEARRLLRTGGRYAIHELAVTPDDIDSQTLSTLHVDLSKSIHVGVRIGTVYQWGQWLIEAGFAIEKVITKPMRLLEPDRMIRDEGLVGMARFVVNVVRTPGAARRLRGVRRVFREYKSNLCAVAIVARAR